MDDNYRIDCAIDDTGNETCLALSMDTMSLTQGTVAVLELDEDQVQSARFEVFDFEHGGVPYAVTVNELMTDPDDVVSQSAWSRDTDRSISAEIIPAVQLVLQVTASGPNGETVTGGGIIKIRFKAKPYVYPMTGQQPIEAGHT